MHRTVWWTGSAFLVAAAVSLPSVDVVLRSAPAQIRTHDNRVPAGVSRAGVFTLRLQAGEGVWFPELDAGPGHTVHAFGEEGNGLLIPGPLLRVPVGTELRVEVRNTLRDSLTVHGFHDRPGPPRALHIPPGRTRSTRFRVAEAGTYHYWATTRGAPGLRARWGAESQLGGAFIVDPPGPAPSDRILVLGIEDDSAAQPQLRPIRAAVVNGLSWPHGESFTQTVGDTVRMRWLNLTDRRHPIHLHGFYFRVDGRGDGARDTLYTPDQQRLAVTELMDAGGTFALTWVPDRAGNWLVHCHMAEHIGPHIRQAPRSAAPEHAHNHALDAMSGLVTGWRVLPRPTDPVDTGTAAGARQIRLLVQRSPGRFGTEPGLGFALHEPGAAPPSPDSIVIPGPPLVLVRGQPIRITVVNRLDEPTSIHWHGMELESYFDGVSGWSGAGTRITPHVEPGDSFDVHFTPPRAGTFIYHSHFAEEHQLASGMYGPLLVLEPGARPDPQLDQAWILGQHGPGGSPPLVALNGSREPSLELTAGRRHRIRLININPTLPVTFALLADSVPVSWRPVAKDGADLPPSQRGTVPATLMIGVGEAYDFEIEPAAAGELHVRVIDPGGILRLVGTVRVRPPRP